MTRNLFKTVGSMAALSLSMVEFSTLEEPRVRLVRRRVEHFEAAEKISKRRRRRLRGKAKVQP